MISFLIYGSMVHACYYLVMIFHWHRGWSGLIVVLAYSLHFLDSHGVVGFSIDLFSGWGLKFLMVVGCNKFSGIPGTTWVELLVLEPRLEKFYKALGGLIY